MSQLRVLFITEDDPLYVIRFFEVFFQRYPREEFAICGITIAKAFHEPKWRTAQRMWRFYGPRDFVRLLWRYLNVKCRGDSIETLARRQDIALVPTDSVNTPEFIATVKGLSPDVIVSVAAPEIFREGILSAARLRCVNIHSGRLPKYRGMMPNFWQLLHGERCATVTVHEMVPKLDAGAVLGTLEFPLKEHDSLDRVITQTKRAGAELMIRVLRQIAAGTAVAKPLDMSEAGYFRFPTRTDVKAFRSRGHHML